MAKHTCKYWSTHRGMRFCKFCGRRQYTVASGEWRWSMSLQQFANNWLPAVSGTSPEDMMLVRVAFPFEWNCYESWNVVFRVKFRFPDVLARRNAGLGTLVDIMNGWQSEYQEDFVRIDHEARLYYQSRTGQPYQIGDNTYAEMRRIIQG